MLLFLAFAAHAALPGADAVWTEIQSSPVKIECTTVGESPYCRSTGVISAPPATAVATFAALDQHVSKMGAIAKVERLETDVLHVVMDYPFPLSDRDYVARFAQRTDPDGTTVFAWTPITHSGAPEEKGVIRLTWLDGEWRFAADGSNTRVTYIWQSDPGGGLPDVKPVYKQAGTLAVRDIATACGAEIVSP